MQILQVHFVPHSGEEIRKRTCCLKVLLDFINAILLRRRGIREKDSDQIFTFRHFLKFWNKTERRIVLEF